MSDSSVERFQLARDLTKGEEKLFSSDGIKPAWQPLREELLDSLRKERPDCDTITLLTLERISFIYVKMRQMEASSTELSTFDQKTFMSMYNELTNSLNKIDEKHQTLENMRAEATQMLVSSLVDATSHLPQSQQQDVMARFLGEVE